jgi:hypothetical protein
MSKIEIHPSDYWNPPNIHGNTLVDCLYQYTEKEKAVVAGDKGVQKAAWRPGRCRRPAHERIGSRAMAKRRLTTLSLSDPCICNNNAAGHGHPRLRYDALRWTTPFFLLIWALLAASCSALLKKSSSCSVREKMCDTPSTRERVVKQWWG